jgi:tmRNA-binding protein
MAWLFLALLALNTWRINMDDVEQLKLLLKKYLVVETTTEIGWDECTTIVTTVFFDEEEICKSKVEIKEGK